MGWLGGALGWVWDHTLGPVASGAAGFVWDQVVQGLVSWIVDSVSWFVGQVLTLLEDSTKVDLRAGWFLDPGGPYRTVLGIAAALLGLPRFRTASWLTTVRVVTATDP